MFAINANFCIQNEIYTISKSDTEFRKIDPNMFSKSDTVYKKTSITVLR